MMSENKKYIQIRHWDYWYSIYGIGEYSLQDATSVEFSITNDQKGNKRFFHLDYINLEGLENIVEEDDYIDKNDKNYELFLHKYQSLKNDSLEYFISSLYYPDKKFGEGYSYLPFSNFDMLDKPVFEIKNKKNKKPNYGIVFIGEKSPLTPEKLLQWLEKLSVKFFSKDIKYEFAYVPSKEETQEAYEDDARF